MTDWNKVILAIAPSGKAAIRSGLVSSISQIMQYADLSTNLRMAMFLAQCAHESDGFATTTEYASGKAYEGRKDLGNTQAGDGVRYKGRGLIQITGRANYSKAGAALNLPLISNPETAANFPAAALTAAWFWKAHDLNAPADRGSVSAVTLRINGGENGLASRETYYKRALAAIGDLKGALTTRAAEEATAAKQKTATATASVVVSTTASGTSIAAGHAVSGGSVIGLIVVAAALMAAAAFLIIRARQHSSNAQILTAAAQEA